MSSICIIPARKNSKRIAHKNTKSFLGRPICEYVFDTAKASGLFDKIVVSTDDNRVAGLAGKNQIEIIRRPSNLCGDTATTAQVLEHALWCHDGFDNACCLYPTAVFTTSADLTRGFNELPFPSFAAQKYPASVDRAFTSDWHMVYPDQRDARTQNLLDYYFDAGQFYWVEVERFFRKPALLDKNLRGVIMPKPTVDINEPDDWRLAEVIYEAYYS